MTTNLNSWFKANVTIRDYGETSHHQAVRKPLVCNDGTTLSVQASDTHTGVVHELVMSITTQVILNSSIILLLKSGR